MKVSVTDRGGEVLQYEVASLAELYRRFVDEMKVDGLCGGCCSCATCHVYLGEGCYTTVAGPSPDEADVLSGLLHVKPESRLLCQLELSAGAQNFELTLAPAE